MKSLFLLYFNNPLKCSRVHPEFQLNEPPRHPFWFTPASFIGELVIKKDALHIEYLKMYLPNHIKLNIGNPFILFINFKEDQPAL